MSPERNEPCPCGSGKKYKKCCGAVPAEQDPIKRNRDIAYTGDIGLRRQQFCLDYAIYKKDVMAHGEQLVRDKIAAAGETITCKKGCGDCCIIYVFADLQEAECITYYLYQHEDVLQHFLSAYENWHRGLGPYHNKIARLDQMIARNMSGKLSPEEQARFAADTNGFAARHASCPFLLDNACTIYEVRPFVCSSAIATTPAEKCVFGTPGASEAKYYRYGFQIEKDRPYFVKPRNSIVFGCMPELVHRILEEGYSFLASIDGLENLRH